MDELNNELLMKNHEARPIGSTAFPEVNAMMYDNKKNYDHGHGRGRGRDRDRGRGH